MGKKLISSESVSCGHPDKVADQISDAVLDAALMQDPSSKVACEVMVKTGIVILGGEISTNASLKLDKIARETIKQIGYTDPALGFSADSCAVISIIGRQSPDIQCGVVRSNPYDQGAGDQGTVVGYACDETDAFMPAAIFYAHRLMQQQDRLRRSQRLPWLRPDAKALLTLEYENQLPKRVHSCTLSTQHSPDITHAELVEAVKEHIILPILPPEWIDVETIFWINSTGRFIVGGPQSDTGLTGRKLMVDSYGTYAHHGGGAFSGKDPSKVDRSAAYMARYLAKQIVSAKLAQQCEVHISYAIGVAQPTAIHVNTFQTGKVPEKALVQWIQKYFDLTPYGIIQKLELLRPLYQLTAAYGHFGRPEFPWEILDCEDKFFEFGA